MLPSFRPACSPFKEQQLKQFRAQCIIFLALRNKKEPQKLHLDVALAGFPAQGVGGGGPGDRRSADGGRGGEASSSSSSSSSSQASSSADYLPLPQPLPISSLRLSSSSSGTELKNSNDDGIEAHDNTR